jgi:hypothetical protein
MSLAPARRCRGISLSRHLHHPERLIDAVKDFLQSIELLLSLRLEDAD